MHRSQSKHACPASVARAVLPFRAVNRAGRPGHDASMQKHHLLPRSLGARPQFRALFEAIGTETLGSARPLDDFRTNGLLLPCSEKAALAFAMPLHRGPHRQYTELVSERVAQVEKGWAASRRAAPRSAAVQAQMRLSLLQGALRRLLLDGRRRRTVLNLRDPWRPDRDFVELDAMADLLWSGTAIPAAPAPPGQRMPARTASSLRAA